jgi:NADPH:quinone reductase-like Zn-dependent oxidoreductase
MDRTISNGGFASRMPATFPMIVGSDMSGVVTAVGDKTSKFSPGDEVFGQLLISPLGSAGTYAEQVAVANDAPIAMVPEGLDLIVAAALPTAGATGLELVESPGPLTGKTALIVGAGGSVGSFATQFAAQAGAQVIANAAASAAERLLAYGAAETVDHRSVSLPEFVRERHPGGIDVLVDMASDASGFAALASLVRPGGAALTTLYVADVDSLAAAGVTGVNFQVSVSTKVLERLADAVVDGRLVPPPITRVGLDDVPSAWASGFKGNGGVKTVITV